MKRQICLFSRCAASIDRSGAWRHAFVLASICCGLAAAGISRADEPVAVPAGAGSYASFPPAHEDDKRREKVADLATRKLYIDAEWEKEPILTNQWWTSLLINPFSGTMWPYPLAVSTYTGGVCVYMPVAWNEKGTDFETGEPLEILADHGTGSTNPDIVLADFESERYPDGWVVAGCFDIGPSEGSFPNQTRVSGFHGNRLANSCFENDAAEGVMESTEFPINRRYLKFLIGGGNLPDDAFVRLLIDGNEVRKATGRDSEQLRWSSWDVKEFAGKNAKLEIVDAARGGWGHILLDDVTLTDSEPSADKDAPPTSFLGQDARARNWSDWMVQARIAATDGARIDATFVRGMPFCWAEFSGARPVIKLPKDATVTDLAGAPAEFPLVKNAFLVALPDRKFAVFVPAETRVDKSGNLLKIVTSSAKPFVVVAPCPTGVSPELLQKHALMIPRRTEYSWSYSPQAASVATTWRIDGEPLEGAPTPFLQGWIPHHCRNTKHDLAFAPAEFETPRGPLKCAIGKEFHIAFPFPGLLPTPPLPDRNSAGEGLDWDDQRMAQYLVAQSEKLDYGGDTYWGGKDIMRYAQHLAIAAQINDPTYDALLERSRGSLIDWMTYTPGETEHYFAWYERWKGLVGFNDSYNSSHFTDAHFHHGYFTSAAAMLGTVDPTFVKSYWPILDMVAKHYANWDRKDKRFPHLRTFDVWGGRSYAGGFGGPGGNNQESSSEAMQSWGGLFLLGAVGGNAGMRDAGAMGYAVEREATMQYWFNYGGWKDPAASVFPANYKHDVVGILFNGG